MLQQTMPTFCPLALVCTKMLHRLPLPLAFEKCWPIFKILLVGGLSKKFAIKCVNTHTHLMALYPGLPGSASSRKVKPIWILLEQQTVSGSGISWAKCKSAPRSRQITTPAPHQSVFYMPDALPATQPTASKH